TREMFWATESNAWTRIAPTNPAEERNVAAISIPAGAGRIRFIGIEITGLELTDPMPPGWDVPGATLNNQGMQLLLVNSAADDVVWDRCYIHGYPKPARFHKGISLRGKRVAVIE